MKLARYVKFREEKFGGVVLETRWEKVFIAESREEGHVGD